MYRLFVWKTEFLSSSRQPGDVWEEIARTEGGGCKRKHGKGWEGRGEEMKRKDGRGGDGRVQE